MVKSGIPWMIPIAPAQCSYNLIHQYTKSLHSLLARFDGLLEGLGGAQWLCGSVQRLVRNNDIFELVL
jgi:hypothetical protein